MKRYERQLGLSLTGLGRLLGPLVARSVALTGSDPYFRTGTDVAVLFEAENAALLEALLTAQITRAAAHEPTAKPESGLIDGLSYQGVRSPDRTVCAYVARLGGAVVVTNSLYQLGRLAAVSRGRSPAIATLPEYVYFRHRYRLGDPEETALVFLSDATIRRWCGPRWRIAASRQTRDMAVLAELQASNMDRLAKRAVQPGPIYTDFATADAGDLSLEAAGVRSSVQGSLEFMTPLAEIPLTKVTPGEQADYGRWRDGYQQNWRWGFDPIALRLTCGTGVQSVSIDGQDDRATSKDGQDGHATPKDRLAADLSVMPLIWGSDYREMISLSDGASFAPDAGDPHDALLQVILAINKQSPLFRQAESFIAGQQQGATVGWLGPSISLFVNDNPIWQELAKVPPEKLHAQLDRYIGRLPVAVRFDVSDGLRLTLFLAALRAYIEQTTPGMVAWETLKYRDQPYVKISLTARGKGTHSPIEQIYYAASGDALVVALGENVLKRAIDRELVRAAEKKGQPSADAHNPKPAGAARRRWLGSNLALEVDRKLLDTAAGLIDETPAERQQAMQLLAWGNLPILNEWKRLYPDQDPVAVHERVWKVRLLDPAGGRYVWNDRWQTMESTVYGHPGEPKTGPDVPPALIDFAHASFGLTFENQGLRASLSLERKRPESGPAAEQ